MIAQGFFFCRARFVFFCSIFFRGHFSAAAAVAAGLPIKNYDSSYIPLGFFKRKKGRKKKKELDKRQKSRHATRQEVHVIGGGREARGGLSLLWICFGSAGARLGEAKQEQT